MVSPLEVDAVLYCVFIIMVIVTLVKMFITRDIFIIHEAIAMDSHSEALMYYKIT